MCYNSIIKGFLPINICEVIMNKETINGVDFKKEIKKDDSWFNATEFFITVAIVIIFITVMFL
jgi:hypothetical protein